MKNKNIIVFAVVLIVLGLGAYLFLGNQDSEVENIEQEELTEEQESLDNEENALEENDSSEEPSVTNETNNETSEPEENTDEENTETESNNEEEAVQVKTFQVFGSNYSFSTEEIRVNEGDTVIIEFESRAGMHDWKVDGFNAATDIVNPGTKTSVEFVASQKGEFEYYCSVGNHRALGMVGTLIVE